MMNEHLLELIELYLDEQIDDVELLSRLDGYKKVKPYMNTFCSEQWIKKNILRLP